MSSIFLNAHFLLVAAVNFCLFLIVATWSFLPVVIVEMGGDKADVGMVMGSLGITSLGSLPFVAPLIDRWGRKFFMVSGILLMGLTNGGYMLFDHYSPLMICVRLLQGLAFAMCFNACATSVVDLVPSDKRAQGIGLFGVSGSLAVSVGPYIGETCLLTWGRDAYFVLMMGFGLIGFLMALLVREPERKNAGTTTMMGFFPTAARDGHLGMMTTAVIFGSGFAAMTTFFPLLARDLGLRAGIFFVCYGLTLILVRFLLGTLADSLNRDRLIFACLLGFGVMLAATSGISSLTQTMFLGALFGLVQGLSYPAMMARMVDRSNDQNRAVVVALFTGSFGVGINVSVLAWGFLAKTEGLPLMFLAAGILMFAAAALHAYVGVSRSAESESSWGLVASRQRTVNVSRRARTSSR
ncbi:MAG: MFS transporter [Desulfomonile tiedjei]|nr:MFS transporter [Desulfomonile tiedjei]